MNPEEHISEAPSHQDQPFIPQNNQDAGDSAQGSQLQPGMGQSKSSRRRRRKRKNKTIGAQPGSPQPAAEGQPADIQAAAASQSLPAPAQNHQQQGGGAGGKRWKKKFRDRSRPHREENPGNSFQPGNTVSGYSNNGGGGYGGGFKRKGGKQRKDRSFVGPMDHSYRATNGNFADSPPSTIEIQGNHHGNGRSHHNDRPRYTSDSQPIDYSQGRTVPIPEGTPTKIYFFIEDLFFFAKIQETARKLGVKIAFIKADKDKDMVAELTDLDEENKPALIVFDLNNANVKPLTLIPKLKAKFKRGTSIIGFLSHLQGDLKAKAVEAGCDTVMPRSAFSQNLPNLLRRYSAVEEEEPNFNQ